MYNYTTDSRIVLTLDAGGTNGSGAKVCVLRIPYYNMQHKAGVYADNGAVLTDCNNKLKTSSTTGEIYRLRQLRRARCGELNP